MPDFKRHMPCGTRDAFVLGWFTQRSEGERHAPRWFPLNQNQGPNAELGQCSGLWDQLNGPNGEYTQSDDVEDARFDNLFVLLLQDVFRKEPNLLLLKDPAGIYFHIPMHSACADSLVSLFPFMAEPGSYLDVEVSYMEITETFFICEDFPEGYSVCASEASLLSFLVAGFLSADIGPSVCDAPDPLLDWSLNFGSDYDGEDSPATADILYGSLFGVPTLPRDSEPVPSQLNGSHGEVTETDDHDAAKPGSIDAGLAQLNPEKGHVAPRPPKGKAFITNAARFQKPTNKTRDADNASRRVEGKPKKPRDADPSDVEPLAPVPPREPDRQYVVSSPGGYYWTGKAFATIIDGLGAVTESGEIFHVSPPDVPYMNVVNNGPGYFTVSGDISKGAPIVSRSCTKIVKIGDDLVRQVPGYSNLVFIPLMTSLTKDLPGEVKNHTLSGALAIARSRFGSMHNSLLTDTCKTYISQVHISSNVGKTSVIALKPLELTSLDARERMQVTLGGVSLFYEQPTKVYAVDCNLPVDWVPRDRYDVRCFGGALCDLKADPVLYPTFVTPAGLTPRWYDTEFFRFVGDGCAPFVTYAESPCNTTQAFKRFLAAREDNNVDDMYYANQAIMLDHLTYYQTRTSSSEFSMSVLKTIRTRFRKTNGDQTMVVGGPHGHTISLALGGVVDPVSPLKEVLDLPGSCSAAIIPLVVEFIEGCGKTYLDAAVHKVSEVKDWAYFNVHMAKMTLMEPFLSREGCAQITHIKQKLRQWYVTKQEVHLDDLVMVKRLQAKVKRELGKFGKVPRFFVTYEAGSMYSNELPEFLKLCMDGERFATFGNVTVITYLIAKPRKDSFSETFAKALMSIHVENTLFVAIYSDDTLYAGNLSGTQFMYNVDISSCDCNQNSFIFYTLGMMLGQQHEARALGLIEQCMKPVRVENPMDPHEYFEIAMHGPLEGSGTTLTTPLNHTASYISALAVGFCLNELLALREDDHIAPSLDDIRSSITTGAGLVGHKVTTSFCGDLAGNIIIEKAQFMKKSPMRTTAGNVVPTTNTGCVLRSLGLVQGDMLPEKLSLTPEVYESLSWQQRSDRFTAGVIHGFKHEPSNPILEALRSRFLSGTTPVSELERVFSLNNQRNPDLLDLIDLSVDTISPASFQARYEFSDLELEELLAQIRSCRVGAINSSRACTKIYTVDYEVGPQTI